MSVINSYESLFPGETYRKMTAGFLRCLDGSGITLAYNKNDLLTERELGDIALIKSGSFYQKLYSLSGKEVILYCLCKGTVVGEDEMFINHQNILVTQASCKSTIHLVKAKDVRRILVERPELNHYFIQSVIRKMNILILAFSDICLNTAEGAVASFIIRQTYLNIEQINKNSSCIPCMAPCTHNEIASRLNLNRVTVTKIINNFIAQGLISVENKCIKVLSPLGLRALINPIGLESSDLR